MKVLSAVLGAMIASACSGDSGEADQAVGSADATSAFDMLRGGHRDRDDRGDRDDRDDHCDRDDHRDHRDHGSRAIRAALRRGADRLAALQADTIGDNAGNGVTDTDPDDGGWDFIIAPSATSHTPSASPTNLYGETALGAWAAVDSGSAGNRALADGLAGGSGRI
jgi:hypothetical protein